MKRDLLTSLIAVVVLIVLLMRLLGDRSRG